MNLAQKFGTGMALASGQLYLVHTPGHMETLHQTLSLSKALVDTGTLFKQQVDLKLYIYLYIMYINYQYNIIKDINLKCIRYSVSRAFLKIGFNIYSIFKENLWKYTNL